MTNKSLIAALLSALVFPGSGHLYLRRFKTGAALIAISLAALVLVTRFIVGQVRVMAERILAGEMPLDPIAISEQVRTSIHMSDLTHIRVAVWVLVICWVIGIVDSYRVGQQKP